MFNEKRIEDIRKKIQTSTLLSDHEKADWLNLLSLMNDKQLGELEEILAAEKPASAATPVPTVSVPAKPAAVPPLAPQAPIPPQPQKLPPLSHIDNIPTDVSVAQPAPLSPPVPNVQPNLQPVPKAPQTAPTAAPKPPVQKTSLALEHAEDLEDLSIETLRNFEEQSIIDAIKFQIEQHGYFVVLQLIEASPLYESYIASGQAQLKGEAATPDTDSTRLSQAEFEFMTDLLSNMRFNRL